MRSLVVVMLIGCRAAPPPPPPVVINDLPEPPPPPACITPPDAATHITHAYGDATRILYCIGDASDQCFSLELGSGKLARLPEAPAAPNHAARIETTNPEVKVCTGEACTALTQKIMPGTAPLHATTNDAGTIAVVLLGDAPAGKGYAEVWDVVAGKRLAAFPYARGEFRCGEVSMVGDTIYIAASTCGAPAARGALYSQRGQKIANVGGREFGAYGGAFAQVDPTTWAFLEENANRIAIQDVVRGKVKKTIDTSQLWSPDGTVKDAMGNPGESTLITLGDGKLAVIAGAPADGSVAIVDIASGHIDVTRAPVCNSTP
jgi:hypothetical protein